VDSLLEVTDEVQFRASGITPAAEKEIQEVIEKHNGQLVESGKPSTTLQELFLDIVSESEARPGRRVSRQESRD
jgi:ABC-2 type transport system ATP-binding protein